MRIPDRRQANRRQRNPNDTINFILALGVVGLAYLLVGGILLIYWHKGSEPVNLLMLASTTIGIIGGYLARDLKPHQEPGSVSSANVENQTVTVAPEAPAEGRTP